MSGLLEKLKNLITRRDDQQDPATSNRARPERPTPEQLREAPGGGRRGFGDGEPRE